MNEQNENNETAINFIKKGFLLDGDSLEFFTRLGVVKSSEAVLNHLFIITKSRMISKKLLCEHFKDVKRILNLQEPEKLELLNNFFGEAIMASVVEIKKQEDTGRLESSDIKVLSSNVIPYRRIEVKDFVTHFKNRYNFLRDILQDRKELESIISINKLGNNRNFSIIGLVSQKRITKNKNLILELEDPTGKLNVLITQDKENIMKKAKEVILDDVIAVKCSGNGNFVYANDIFFADSFIGEKKKAEQECYAIFTADVHVGSKLFLKKSFERFLAWLNGEGVDDFTKDKIKKIKYLFLAGDNVDGVGIYPGQEALLEIKDMKNQYKQLADYLKLIPKHIKIIICPGQHDGVRVPEPQPPIDEEFAKELCEMKNVYLVSNPAMIEIGCGEKKKGFKVLMYHGASMVRGWIDEIEDLRVGQAHLNPSKVVKYMLRHRHLSPTHSGNVYVPSEKEDTLLVKEIPDIVITGDLHKSDVDIYNNILIICGSCWQSTTPFEEKLGNHPDPCKVPMLNLKTREIKILDFTQDGK